MTNQLHHTLRIKTNRRNLVDFGVVRVEVAYCLMMEMVKMQVMMGWLYPNIDAVDCLNSRHFLLHRSSSNNLQFLHFHFGRNFWILNMTFPLRSFLTPLSKISAIKSYQFIRVSQITFSAFVNVMAVDAPLCLGNVLWVHIFDTFRWIDAVLINN